MNKKDDKKYETYTSIRLNKNFEQAEVRHYKTLARKGNERYSSYVSFKGHPIKVWKDYSSYLIDTNYLTATIVWLDLIKNKGLFKKKIIEFIEGVV